jgi:hypothetical protein
MVGPLVFGAVASGSLVLGALVGACLDPPEPRTGTVVAFVLK